MKKEEEESILLHLFLVKTNVFMAKVMFRLRKKNPGIQLIETIWFICFA